MRLHKMKGSKEVDIQGQGRRRDKLCPASIKYAIHSIKVAIIVLVSLNINKNIVCAHCSSVLSGSSRWEWGILTLVTYSLSVNSQPTVTDGGLAAISIQHMRNDTELGMDAKLAPELPESVLLFLDNLEISQPETASNRSSRQLRVIASALRTMGCLPKFFCGKNSENRGNSQSTLNDLAYLIKFATADAEFPLHTGQTDSKLDNGDNTTLLDNDLHHRGLAGQYLVTGSASPPVEGSLVQHNPSQAYAQFRTPPPRFLGKMAPAISSHMSQAGSKGKKQSTLATILSPFHRIYVRLGRSVDSSENPDQDGDADSGSFEAPKINFETDGERKGTSTSSEKERINKASAFWRTPDFKKELKLAARIGQAASQLEKAEGEELCSATFNQCPYTIDEMKEMTVGGEGTPDADKGGDKSADNGSDEQNVTFYEQWKRIRTEEEERDNDKQEKDEESEKRKFQSSRVAAAPSNSVFTEPETMKAAPPPQQKQRQPEDSSSQEDSHEDSEQKGSHAIPARPQVPLPVPEVKESEIKDKTNEEDSREQNEREEDSEPEVVKTIHLVPKNSNDDSDEDEESSEERNEESSESYNQNLQALQVQLALAKLAKEKIEAEKAITEKATTAEINDNVYRSDPTANITQTQTNLEIEKKTEEINGTLATTDEPTSQRPTTDKIQIANDTIDDVKENPDPVKGTRIQIPQKYSLVKKSSAPDIKSQEKFVEEFQKIKEDLGDGPSEEEYYDDSAESLEKDPLHKRKHFNFNGNPNSMEPISIMTRNGVKKMPRRRKKNSDNSTDATSPSTTIVPVTLPAMKIVLRNSFQKTDAPITSQAESTTEFITTKVMANQTTEATITTSSPEPTSEPTTTPEPTTTTPPTTIQTTTTPPPTTPPPTTTTTTTTPPPTTTTSEPTTTTPPPTTTTTPLRTTTISTTSPTQTSKPLSSFSALEKFSQQVQQYFVKVTKPGDDIINLHSTLNPESNDPDNYQEMLKDQEEKSHAQKMLIELEKKRELEKKLLEQQQQKLREEEIQREMEKKRVEEEYQKELERKRIEEELKKELERKRIEEELKKELERKRIEEELRKEMEKKRIEEELQKELEKKRIEEELQKELEKKRIEEELEKKRIAEELEKKRIAEELKIELEKKRIEEELQRELERKRIEEELELEKKRIEEESRKELEKQLELEKKRIEQELQQELERKRIKEEMERELERQRIEEELELERKRIEEESRKKLEEKLKLEKIFLEQQQQRRIEEEKQKLVKEQKKLEQKRLHEQRLLEQKRLHEQKLLEQKRLHEQKLLEQKLLEREQQIFLEQQQKKVLEQKILEQQQQKELEKVQLEQQLLQQKLVEHEQQRLIEKQQAKQMQQKRKEQEQQKELEQKLLEQEQQILSEQEEKKALEQKLAEQKLLEQQQQKQLEEQKQKLHEQKLAEEKRLEQQKQIILEQQRQKLIEDKLRDEQRQKLFEQKLAEQKQIEQLEQQRRLEQKQKEELEQTLFEHKQQILKEQQQKELLQKKIQEQKLLEQEQKKMIEHQQQKLLEQKAIEQKQLAQNIIEQKLAEQRLNEQKLQEQRLREQQQIMQHRLDQQIQQQRLQLQQKQSSEQGHHQLDRISDTPTFEHEPQSQMRVKHPYPLNLQHYLKIPTTTTTPTPSYFMNHTPKSRRRYVTSTASTTDLSANDAQINHTSLSNSMKLSHSYNDIIKQQQGAASNSKLSNNRLRPKPVSIPPITRFTDHNQPALKTSLENQNQYFPTYKNQHRHEIPSPRPDSLIRTNSFENESPELMYQKDNSPLRSSKPNNLQTMSSHEGLMDHKLQVSEPVRGEPSKRPQIPDRVSYLSSKMRSRVPTSASVSIMRSPKPEKPARHQNPADEVTTHKSTDSSIHKIENTTSTTRHNNKERNNFPPQPPFSYNQYQQLLQNQQQFMAPDWGDYEFDHGSYTGQNPQDTYAWRNWDTFNVNPHLGSRELDTSVNLPSTMIPPTSTTNLPSPIAEPATHPIKNDKMRNPAYNPSDFDGSMHLSGTDPLILTTFGKTNQGPDSKPEHYFQSQEESLEETYHEPRPTPGQTKFQKRRGTPGNQPLQLQPNNDDFLAPSSGERRIYMKSQEVERTDEIRRYKKTRVPNTPPTSTAPPPPSDGSTEFLSSFSQERAPPPPSQDKQSWYNFQFSSGSGGDASQLSDDTSQQLSRLSFPASEDIVASRVPKPKPPSKPILTTPEPTTTTSTTPRPISRRKVPNRVRERNPVTETPKTRKPLTTPEPQYEIPSVSRRKPENSNFRKRNKTPQEPKPQKTHSSLELPSSESNIPDRTAASRRKSEVKTRKDVQRRKQSPSPVESHEPHESDEPSHMLSLQEQNLKNDAPDMKQLDNEKQMETMLYNLMNGKLPFSQGMNSRGRSTEEEVVIKSEEIPKSKRRNSSKSKSKKGSRYKRRGEIAPVANISKQNKRKSSSHVEIPPPKAIRTLRTNPTQLRRRTKKSWSENILDLLG